MSTRRTERQQFCDSVRVHLITLDRLLAGVPEEQGLTNRPWLENVKEEIGLIGGFINEYEAAGGKRAFSSEEIRKEGRAVDHIHT